MKGDTRHSIIFSVLCFYMWNVRSEERYRKFVLGGLFPVHSEGDGPHQCGSISPERGIQRMEAMLYAIKKINEDPGFWKFTLDANILDTCSSDSHALAESLKFLKMDCGGGNTQSTQRVIGVIGAAKSPVSEAVATIFRLFHIPQISYASTSTELDNKHKYPYFFRVVPSDIHQVKAIIALLRHLNWTFLSTVASEGEYGKNAVQELKSHVVQYDICFEKTVTLQRNPTDEDYKSAIHQLLSNKQAKAVVVFLNEDKLSKLLSAANELKVESGSLLWLGSDSWGTKKRVISNAGSVVEGAITILPMQYPVLDFDQHFTALKPNRQDENPWFREFWKAQFNCTPTDSLSDECFGKTLSVGYKQEGLVPMVIDAVYVMAHALKNMCSSQPSLCENEDEPPSGKTFIRYIKEVSINSSRGHGMIICFDSNRSVPVNYSIYQIKRNSSGFYEYVNIGSWSKAGLNLSVHHIDPNESTCSPSCEYGSERVRNTDKKCCWKCSKCEKNHYVPSPESPCTPCKTGLVPNDHATECIWIEPQYFGKDLNSPWAAIPLVFAILGVICSVVMYLAFWIYHNTPIIMASGRELCHFIFLGVFLCYCWTFVTISRPTPFSCGAGRVGLGLGLAIIYSAVFTKTNRISRIFNRTMRSAKRPRYVTPKSQIIICLSLVIIELLFSTIWLLLEPPKVIPEQVDKIRPLVETCELRNETVCLAMILNMLLVVLCTIYAYKTRKIPENFNEAKYISFAMYSNCIIWMAFVPTYFSVSSDYMVRSTLLSMGISMSGTVALVCIFIPKLYIVIFQPQKNVRFPTTTNSGTAAQTGPIRFVKTVHAVDTLTPETKLCDVDKRPNSKTVTIGARTMNTYDSS